MLYAKQVNPEYQESWIFEDDRNSTDYICVFGNKDYTRRTSSLFDRVLEVLQNGELAEILEDIETGGYYSAWYKNATQAINDLLCPEKEKYNTRDIHALKELVKAFASCLSSEEDDIICKVLSVVCGYEWDYRIIRGCCQGDWNYIFYPVKYWTEKALNAFEVMYFNTGSEWIIHDEEEAPESPEDINGYSVYCISWNDEGIRKEIAKAANVSPEDVIMYSFDGYKKIPVYKAV